MADVIALINMKGGVGKTTLAVNLAWHTFKRASKNVLIVDMDPQFNASQYLMKFDLYKEHVTNCGTIADVLIDSPKLTLRAKTAKPSVKKRIANIESNVRARLDLLPSELALSHVVKNPAQMEYRLEKLLQPLSSQYDYIFIDCAPTDSVLTTMTLNASDFLLVPIRPDRFSILGFALVLETIRQFRDSCHDPHLVKDLGVVFTQLHENNQIESECVDEIKQLAGERDIHVFKSSLKYSSTFGRAIQDQKPAFETRFARDDLKTSIAAVAREMALRIDELKKARVTT